MKDQKTSIFSNGLLWFGAAVSIAEILTGTYLATLGFTKALQAILLGHLIGCVLLFLAGLIGGRTGKSAMETVKMSFGEKGSLLFTVLNVLQLIGWTAIMIISGARATATLADPTLGFSSIWIWCLVIGGLILVWIIIGVKNLSKLNTIAMTALFLLTILLSVIVFRGNLSGEITNDLSFGAGVELAAAMPLSWLPLISDYTRVAKKPFKATAVSAIVYFLASSWMYVIGMGAAIFTGESDIATIMLQAGLGILGVIIIIISTVSTTFLDAFSAGVSSVSISSKIKEKKSAIIICVVGILLAIFTPIENFENFLYLIGSVFAPMIAIQIADYFIMKREAVKKQVNLTNLIIWAAGFIIYRTFLSIDTPVGSTLPVMVITIAICIIVQSVKKAVLKNK
ncbi:MAG: putative hydroxymethylpyrimidine transporter CytX [Mobilitalea sp.]